MPQTRHGFPHIQRVPEGSLKGAYKRQRDAQQRAEEAWARVCWLSREMARKQKEREQELKMEQLQSSQPLHLIHVTADRKQMFIAQMDDDHLTNTIKLFFRRIENSRGRLSSEAVSREKQALYGIDEQSEFDKAKLELQQGIGRLMPYVYEATLRGLFHPGEGAEGATLLDQFRHAVGRSAAETGLPMPASDNLLPMPNEIIDATQDVDDEDEPF